MTHLNKKDPLLKGVKLHVRSVATKDQDISVRKLMKRYKIGYARATRIMNALIAEGILNERTKKGEKYTFSQTYSYNIKHKNVYSKVTLNDRNLPNPVNAERGVANTAELPDAWTQIMEITGKIKGAIKSSAAPEEIPEEIVEPVVIDITNSDQEEVEKPAEAPAPAPAPAAESIKTVKADKLSESIEPMYRAFPECLSPNEYSKSGDPAFEKYSKQLGQIHSQIENLKEKIKPIRSNLNNMASKTTIEHGLADLLGDFEKIVKSKNYVKTYSGMSEERTRMTKFGYSSYKNVNYINALRYLFESIDDTLHDVSTQVAEQESHKFDKTNVANALDIIEKSIFCILDSTPQDSRNGVRIRANQAAETIYKTINQMVTGKNRAATTIKSWSEQVSYAFMKMHVAAGVQLRRKLRPEKSQKER